MRYAISICFAMVALHDAALLARGDENEFDRGRYARRATENRGDPGRGGRLLQDGTRTTCLRCHKIGNQGFEFGPNLSNIGGKLGRDHLVESILEPSRQIVEGYRGIVVSTKAGQVVTGFAPREVDGSLKLVDGKGEQVSIPLTEIDERKAATESAMPERLVGNLSPDEFCDLIAYLETLRSAGQSSPGSGLQGPPSLPPGFEWQTIAMGLTGTVALAAAPDGRVFVCEQTGTLRVIKGDHLLPEPCLTLPVDSQWERGLIGVTIDPRFDLNHHIYVVYVAREPYPHHRVSRFTLVGDVAAVDSERILLEGDDQSKLGGQVPAGHQGGAAHFGGDGRLYVALGEQTAEKPAQALDSLLGKILRIESDGTIPSDNPFVSETSGKYQAIWARGCRNPFTFAVEPRTGLMLINDVGGKFEEINVGRAGANYGWPTVDHGPTTDARFQGPIYWYPQASIAGGAFCPAGEQPQGFPSQFHGRYFFMDFAQGWIRSADANSQERPISAEVFATGLARPVDLTFGSDGSLYVLLRDAWVKDDHFKPATGLLARIRPIAK